MTVLFRLLLVFLVLLASVVLTVLIVPRRRCPKCSYRKTWIIVNRDDLARWRCQRCFYEWEETR